MSFGNILGQILQSGLGGSKQTPSRLGTSAQNLGAGGGGVEQILAQLQGALAGAGKPGGLGGQVGGLADHAKDFLRKDQVGGMTGAQVGGIGALAGALLGGGVGGAARGGALAVLGTLALTALKNAQARQQAGGAAPDADAITLDPSEVAAAVGPEVERLLVRAMIQAAKADGQIDQAEMQKIIGKIGEDGVTTEEKAYVMSQLAAPVDVAALAAEVRGPAQAAEVYGASLLAIDVDTEAERAYLRELAAALGLDPATVAQLHQLTGAPTA
jgi:uncharacterized membrane protein YebE (DUF533 family)